MAIKKVGPFLISRTGNASQIVLLCHGGWRPEQGHVEIPRPMMIHFYTPHGSHNKGYMTAEGILKLGPKARPGAIIEPGAPPRPNGIADADWNNVLAQQAWGISQGQGCAYVMETAGGTVQKVKTHNYGLCLIGPDLVVRPEEKALLDSHDNGDFATGDVDLMILKRNYLKDTNLATAFKAAIKANKGRPYDVFHYAPCRYVENKFLAGGDDLPVEEED